MRLFADIDALPAGTAERLLGGAGFFSSAVWWRTVWEAGVPTEGTPLFGLAGAGEAEVLFALWRDASGRIGALTNPYTCLYQPMAGTPADRHGADIHAAGRELARLARGGMLRLDALDPDWPGLAPLVAGARAGGLVALRFDHFGNWHEPVAGRDWRGYLAARPGALRETVRRRLRDAERNAALSFAVLSEPMELPAGIAEYEAVYARSWKEAEPYPRFNAVLMHEAAQAGLLRLGVLRLSGQAIAVQLWIVQDGVASVLKLAHDEAHKPLSPGTVMTAWMIRRLIATEQVETIDFGRGDDAYKQLWTSKRRQRIGLVLAAPWHPTGVAALLRHAAGRLRHRLAGATADGASTG